MAFDRSEYINQPVVIEKELKTLFIHTETLTIFEIGACEGEDSIRYSRLFKNSKIYAFEPLPKNVQIINKNISEYNAHNISIFNIALSNICGTADFYVSNGKPEIAPEGDWDYGNKSSSLLAPDKHKELASFIDFEEKITIETSTIEAFCLNNKISLIDYIHLDVQGAELMVLQGAGSYIGLIKAIWLEVSKIHIYKDQPLAMDISKFMADNGFILIKDYLMDIQGDQLYIAKKFFPKYKRLKRKLNPPPNPGLIWRLLKKVGLN